MERREQAEAEADPQTKGPSQPDEGLLGAKGDPAEGRREPSETPSPGKAKPH